MSRNAQPRRDQIRHKAIQAINKHGILLVFPLANRALPLSLWSVLHPRTKMRWEWDQDGDTRVSDLWQLRAELSKSREVIYAKWYQGRATLFSFQVFINLLAFFAGARSREQLSSESTGVLELLESDSPLSTKQLKVACELEGKLLESTYNRALKPLWQTLQIVAFGEFEDSSFPSLGIGATQLLFEELWNESLKIPEERAREFLVTALGNDNLFLKYAVKLKGTQAPPAGSRSGSHRQL